MLAAIKAQESGNDGPLVKGDSGKAYGLFQIHKKIWGDFSPTVVCQVKKAEEILEELIRKHGCPDEAIRKYNGGGNNSYRYQKKIINLMKIAQTT
jgi:hypothetical protein